MPVRAGILTGRVVRAGDASARRRAERITRRAGRFLAITAARSVGNQRRGTAASVVSVVFRAVAARTIVRFVLTRGACRRSGAAAFAARYDDLRARTAAFVADGTGNALAVSTFFARSARIFRAFADGFVIVGRTVGRFTRTGAACADVFALAGDAFLRRRTIGIRLAVVFFQIGFFGGADGWRCAVITVAVPQFNGARDCERRGVI